MVESKRQIRAGGGAQNVRCPFCGREMVSGAVQSTQKICFTDQVRKNGLDLYTAGKEEVLLSSHNWTRPACPAFHCPDCRKVILDYSDC